MAKKPRTAAVPITDLSLLCLRRLVQAATDCPDPFAVMNIAEVPYEIAAMVESEQEGQRVLRELGKRARNFKIVGPLAIAGHLHEPIVVEPHTCWSEIAPPVRPKPGPRLDDVTRIKVIIESSTHATITCEYSAPVDAIFLTRSARERFAYPYYLTTFGPEHLAAVRRRTGEA